MNHVILFLVVGVLTFGAYCLGGIMASNAYREKASRKRRKPIEKLTPNTYQQEALRTEPPAPNYIDESTLRLLNGLMGLNGEAGEAIDILKKHVFQGHELDRKHLAKELGDVQWYVAVSANALGYDLETIMQMNVDKLRERYPDRFDSYLSQHRKAGDI